jgi:uncharacterized protein YnzC (UPF0291/DUF896 family)
MPAIARAVAAFVTCVRMTRMETATLDTELTIITRLVAPDEPFYPPEVARAILGLAFAPVDVDRMNELADKAQESELSPQEQVEVESYRRVGHWLSIMKSKARRSLAATRVEP